jgi:hypothetical protein
VSLEGGRQQPLRSRVRLGCKRNSLSGSFVNIINRLAPPIRFCLLSSCAFVLISVLQLLHRTNQNTFAIQNRIENSNQI